MAESACSWSASLRRQRELAFLDARLVAEPVEQVPVQSDGDQPVGSALVVEILAVRFECAVKLDLRKKAAVGRGCLIFGEADRELHLTSFRPLDERVLFVVREHSCR